MAVEVPGLTLNDGTTVPAVGFGTYPLAGAGGVQAIRSALDQGYRLLDSAFNYENEGAVGEAVRTSGIPREDLRVVSKLPGRHHAHAEAMDTIQESVYRAGLDYYDLYLIHWPNPRIGKYAEAWKALVDAQARGLVRSIGVCNFLPGHLERIIQATGVTPSVNQIELHPYFPQQEQRAFNAAAGILTQSWSPLGRANALLSETGDGGHLGVGQLEVEQPEVFPLAIWLGRLGQRHGAKLHVPAQDDLGDRITVSLRDGAYHWLGQKRVRPPQRAP